MMEPFQDSYVGTTNVTGVRIEILRQELKARSGKK
jgi:hypothetical protein